MKVLAIDPSSTELGWAALGASDWLISWGTISTNQVEYAERFQHITQRLTEVADKYQPEIVACERAVRFKGRRISALEVTVTAISRWAKQRKLPFKLYAPAEWKASVVGHGTATKQTTAWLMRLYFGLLGPETSEHVTDAIAIGLHHLGVEKWEIMAAASDRKGR